MPAPRRTGPVALLLPALLLAAACTGPTPDRAAGASALDRFYAQELSWEPCESFARSDDHRELYADPAYDCTYLTVPLDHAAPDGETVRIGVLRKKALDRGARVGSLVTNPGGPGTSGMAAVPTIIAPGLGDAELAQRFDLVGFDPRGVGASEPAIDCLTDPERDEDREDLDVDGSPAGVARAEAEAREFVDRCARRVGVDVLTNVGTRDVARDLDILRAALGDEKLTYLGYSYGTRIGSAYAAAFPDRVRALVLDGAIDPSQDTVERGIAQAAGFQLAFDAFAADCTARPECPLGTDRAQATERFRELVLPLYDREVPALPDRALGYNDAITGTIRALYVQQLWEVLRLGLTELQQGRGRILMLLADDYEDRAQDGSYDNTLEAFRAINCVDEERLTDPAVFLEADRRFREVAPFRDDGRGPTAARDACAFWPAPPTSEPLQTAVPGLPPTLVVSVTGDPATPYEAGVELARLLGGSLLTVEGNQHTVALTGVACVDEIVTRYLVDLATPPEGARCTI